MTTPILSRPVLAVLAILGADFLLTLNDALVTRAQVGVGLWTVFWVRGVVAVPLAVLITLCAAAPLMPKRTLWVVLRTGLLLISWVCLYSALAVMPVANAVATLYTIPLIIALLSAVLDRAWPRPAVLAGIALGFGGVVLIVQPGNADISPAYALPLMSAFVYSCAMIITGRTLTAENPLTVGLWLNYGFLALGLGAMIVVGDQPIMALQQAVAVREWSYAGMGVCVAIATIGVAYAYQNGAATTIATFDYAYLLFAVMWGFVFFGQIPNLLAVLGMIAITVAGLIVMRLTSGRSSGPRNA